MQNRYVKPEQVQDVAVACAEILETMEIEIIEIKAKGKTPIKMTGELKICCRN